MKQYFTDQNAYIVVAAGSGSRFGSDVPKQFCELEGYPMVLTTIHRINLLDAHSTVFVVIADEMRDEFIRLCEQYREPLSPLLIVSGGNSRFESVRNALAYINPGKGCKWISVHDADRPVLNPAMMERMEAARRKRNIDGIIPVVPVSDTLRELTAAGSVVVDRNRYRRVQTPQSFPTEKLMRAYGMAVGTDFTDDASVMEAAGMGNFALVEGDPRNIKVTYPGDMEVAEIYLKDFTWTA